MKTQLAAWWALPACRSVTRALWQQPRRGWFAFGGCLFWLVLIYAWVAFQLIKAALWLVVCAVLLAANLVTVILAGLSFAVVAAGRPLVTWAGSHRSARTGGTS